MPRTHVVFKPDGLGDFVLALGAIRLLAARFGEEHLALVVNTQCADFAAEQFPTAGIVGIKFTSGHLRDDLPALLASLPALWRHRRREVVCLRHQRGRLMQLALLALQPARLFLSENLLRDSSVPFFAGLERRFVTGGGTSVPYPIDAPPDQCLELEANRRVTASTLAVDLSPEAILPAIRGVNIREEPFLLVSPFGSTPVKNYPHLAAAIGLFLDLAASEFEIRLVVTPAQRTDAAHLLEQVDATHRSRISIVTPSSLADFIQMIGGARAVLTVDTSTAHLAASLDKAALILLGGGHFGLYGPWRRSARQRWLYRPMPCFHCFWRCRYETIRCLADIPPEEVAKELTATWNLASLRHAERH